MGTSISPWGSDLGGAELWAGEHHPWSWVRARIPTAVLCPRSTSSTCAPRTPHTPASSGWCGKATSPGPSPAASTPGACSASRPPKGPGAPGARARPGSGTPRCRQRQAQPGAASPRAGASGDHWGCPSVPPSPSMGPSSAPSLPKGHYGVVWAPVTPCLAMVLPQTSAELPLQLGDRSDSQFGWEDALLRRNGGS